MSKKYLNYGLEGLRDDTDLDDINIAKLKHRDITEKIIGASFDVHSFLGNGFQEVIYQRALAWEMGQRELEYKRGDRAKYLL